MNITDLIKEFSRIYKSEVRLPHSKNLKSYDIIVNQMSLK